MTTKKSNAQSHSGLQKPGVAPTHIGERQPQVFDPNDPRVAEVVSEHVPSDSRAPSDEATASPYRDAAHRESADRTGLGTETGGEYPRADRDEPPPAATPTLTERGIKWGSLLLSATIALATLALGVWFSRFVSIAVARDDWVGWMAKGLAILVVIALAALVLREVFGYLRLGRIHRVRRDADYAVANDAWENEQRIVDDLKRLARGRPDMAWGLRRFREGEHHKTQPGELLALADLELLGPADVTARRIIYESARRVAVVTAVVPMAFITMGFVLTENIRMVRRLATVYGGRPGFFGGVRLLWRVIAHVAASGAIALTDDLFGQFIGQDIVHRLSRRLGEGTFNGALTARLGIAALGVCRPLPFIEAPPLRARHIIRELFPEFSPSELVSGVFRRKKSEAEQKPPAPSASEGPTSTRDSGAA